MNNLTTFCTGKVELCFWLTPDDFTNIAGFVRDHLYYWTKTCTQRMGDYPYSIVLPPGEWEPVGSPFDVTEEEARELVPYLPTIEGDRFENFDSGEYEKKYVFAKAIESWHSLLSHLQIYRENPYLRPNEGDQDEDVFWENAAQYQRGESRKGNWILIVREK